MRKAQKPSKRLVRKRARARLYAHLAVLRPFRCSAATVDPTQTVILRQRIEEYVPRPTE